MAIIGFVFFKDLQDSLDTLNCSWIGVFEKFLYGMDLGGNSTWIGILNVGPVLSEIYSGLSQN